MNARAERGAKSERLTLAFLWFGLLVRRAVVVVVVVFVVFVVRTPESQEPSAERGSKNVTSSTRVLDERENNGNTRQAKIRAPIGDCTLK